MDGLLNHLTYLQTKNRESLDYYHISILCSKFLNIVNSDDQKPFSQLIRGELSHSFRRIRTWRHVLTMKVWGEKTEDTAIPRISPSSSLTIFYWKGPKNEQKKEYRHIACMHVTCRVAHRLRTSI